MTEFESPETWVETQKPYDQFVGQPAQAKNKHFMKEFFHLPFVFAWFSMSLIDGSTICAQASYEGSRAISNVAGTYEVSTYNIGRGDYGLDGVLDVLADQDVDTQCLQEAPRQELGQLIGAAGLKTTIENWNSRNLFGEYGNVVLTNDQVIHSQEYNLPSRADHPQRTMLAAVLEDSLGQRRAIFCAHLAAQNGIMPGYGISEREAQVMTILHIQHQFEYRGLPLVLMIDLNEHNDGNAYAILTEELHDTTTDLRQPRRVITLSKYGVQSDYIFVNGLLAAEININGNDSSNHCKLRASLATEPPREPYSTMLSHMPGPR